MYVVHLIQTCMHQNHWSDSIHTAHKQVEVVTSSSDQMFPTATNLPIVLYMLLNIMLNVTAILLVFTQVFVWYGNCWHYDVSCLHVTESVKATLLCSLALLISINV